MTQAPDLNQISADQLRQLATELLTHVEHHDPELHQRDLELARRTQALHRSELRNEQLIHELALLKTSPLRQAQRTLQRPSGQPVG